MLGTVAHPRSPVLICARQLLYVNRRVAQSDPFAQLTFGRVLKPIAFGNENSAVGLETRHSFGGFQLGKSKKGTPRKSFEVRIADSVELVLEEESGVQALVCGFEVLETYPADLLLVLVVQIHSLHLHPVV